MRRRWFVWIAVLPLLIALAACGDEDAPAEGDDAAPGATPTVAQTATAPPTWTPSPEGFVPSRTPTLSPDQAQRATAAARNLTSTVVLLTGTFTPVPAGGRELPPTWTQVPEGFVATRRPSATPRGTVTSAAGDAAGGLELPPTWTPRGPTLAPTVILPTDTPDPGLPTWTPFPDWCYELEALDADDAIAAGQPATVRWQAVPGISRYRITLRHPGGGLLLTEDVDATEFTFEGDYFEVALAYGWSVTPLDANGAPTCYTISDEIVVHFES